MTDRKHEIVHSVAEALMLVEKETLVFPVFVQAVPEDFNPGIIVDSPKDFRETVEQFLDQSSGCEEPTVHLVSMPGKLF